ncbi:hypothetical protein [Microvirga yunnanensis]|nr:hypothetical protein [Microvirga sp. HBU65207]
MSFCYRDLFVDAADGKRLYARDDGPQSGVPNDRDHRDEPGDDVAGCVSG